MYQLGLIISKTHSNYKKFLYPKLSYNSKYKIYRIVYYKLNIRDYNNESNIGDTVLINIIFKSLIKVYKCS